MWYEIWSQNDLMDMIALDQKEFEVYSLYFFLTFISHGDILDVFK